jgi:hypothetical protein
MNEFIETMTGHEEAAVEQRFGLDPYALLEVSDVKASRALVFVHQTRHLKALDVKNPENKAHVAAMDMTLKQVGAFWPDEVEEPDPEAPVTPAGEGDAADAS